MKSKKPNTREARMGRRIFRRLARIWRHDSPMSRETRSTLQQTVRDLYR